MPRSIKRALKLSKTQSFFLFGARGTGKSTLLKSHPYLKKAKLFIDLLDPENEELYSTRPKVLFEQIQTLSSGDWVVIDEVQKIPKILDVIHSCIENKRIKFALTGSSARKLKRGSANLLAGRAISFSLFPFTSYELGKSFDLKKMLEWGSLPALSSLKSDIEKARYLKSYVQNYIKEEIQVEQLVRNLDSFRLFLPLAAQANTEIVNFSNVAAQTGSDHKTIYNYFQILVDTHLGQYLESFGRSIRQVQSKSPKFYFFDIGVKRAIEKRLSVELQEGSSEYGKEFETFFINECFRLNLYWEKDYSFSYLRTKDDAEIDLIVETPHRDIFLIEIKSTRKVLDSHLKHLKSFKKDFPKAKFICVSREDIARIVDGIEILPWKKALEVIFDVKSSVH